MQKRKSSNRVRSTLNENDHLGDRNSGKDYCWLLTFRQPVRKPSSESRDRFKSAENSKDVVSDLLGQPLPQSLVHVINDYIQRKDATYLLTQSPAHKINHKNTTLT